MIFRGRLSHLARQGLSDQLIKVDQTRSHLTSLILTDLLFELVSRRYERRSILVTTNKAFRDWNTVFPNATSIATLLDRLTHHADITMIEGQSYRVRESELETAARRKKS